MRTAFGWLSRTARRSGGLALVVMAIAGTAHAGGPISTPEIDPGSMGSALTLLLGGAMLLRRRFGKN